MILHLREGDDSPFVCDGTAYPDVKRPHEPTPLLVMRDQSVEVTRRKDPLIRFGCVACPVIQSDKGTTYKQFAFHARAYMEVAGIPLQEDGGEQVVEVTEQQVIEPAKVLKPLPKFANDEEELAWYEEHVTELDDYDLSGSEDAHDQSEPSNEQTTEAVV